MTSPDPPSWTQFNHDEFDTGWRGEYSLLASQIRRSLGMKALRCLAGETEHSALLESLQRLRNYSYFSIAHLDAASDERAELERVRPDYKVDLKRPDWDPVKSSLFTAHKRKIAAETLIEMIESGVEMYSHDFKTAALFLDTSKLVNEMEVLAAASRFGRSF